MSDSTRQEHATAFEPSNYTMRTSVVPPAFEQLGHRTTNHAADPVVEVSPPDAVSRRTASGPGVAVEIVQDIRRGRIDYRYCSSRHMLVVHERGLRHDGCTLIEGRAAEIHAAGLQRKTRLRAGRPQILTTGMSRARSRASCFFYFNPIQLAISPLGYSRNVAVAADILRGQRIIMQTATEASTTLIEGRRFRSSAISRSSWGRAFA